MDLALLVKQDMTPKAGDPFSHAISATFIQYHNSTEVKLAFSYINAFHILLVNVFSSLLNVVLMQTSVMEFINLEVMDLDGNILNYNSKC